MILLETTVYSSLERFFLLIFIPFFWKVEIIFIPLSTWRRYTIILKKHHYHCWLRPHLYILNSTTSYLFSHCHIPSSPSWAVISCLIYFLSYGAPSQVWSLCSRQTILSPTPNLLRLLISLRIKFPRPTIWVYVLWEHFLCIFYHSSLYYSHLPSFYPCNVTSIHCKHLPPLRKCVPGCLPTFGWVSLQRHLCKEAFGDYFM